MGVNLGMDHKCFIDFGGCEGMQSMLTYGIHTCTCTLSKNIELVQSVRLITMAKLGKWLAAARYLVIINLLALQYPRPTCLMLWHSSAPTLGCLMASLIRNTLTVW